MVLTLEVVGQQASKLGASARKVFSGAGGTIGRLPENDWPIPDPYISSKHARIDYRDGNYFLVDTSTNGVFVNSQDNRLTRSQPYQLQNGDRIFIDAYEIRVAMSGAAPASSPSPLSDLFGSNAAAIAPTPSRIDDRRGNVSANSGDPFAANDPFGPSSPNAASSGRHRAIIPANAMDELDDVDSDATDPLKLLGLESKRPASAAPRAQDLARQSPLSDHYEPPARVAPINPPVSNSGSAIPDDYDPLSDGLKPLSPQMSPPPSASPPRASASTPSPTSAARATSTPRPTPGGSRASVGASPRTTPMMPGSTSNAPSSTPPAPQPVRPAPVRPPVSSTPSAPKSPDTGASGTFTGRHLDLNALLAGAGLPEAQITPELVENFGRILRVVVAGLMDVLRARERIKDEFRMRMTTFKAADNNPLKFSANVDDALHNLLVKRNAAYLGPVEAFEDAFQDVRNHQMAMLAGVRLAFDAMLGEFDPDRLREQFDRQVKKGSLLSGPAKLRYWELYTDKFRGMVNDRESAFRDLFGDEFARAYEEQLERLKAINRANK